MEKELDTGKPKAEKFHELIQQSRTYARETGLKEEDVKEAIKRVRRENRD
jgi:pantoate kinase